MKRTSKILPNNTALARAARAGEVVKVLTPWEDQRKFKPWSRKQPKYERWFRSVMIGERCQCPDPTCTRQGVEVHHELRGANKDDRAIVWMSMHCHHDVRHAETGCDPGDGPPDRRPYGEAWTPEQYRAGCSAVAGSNWLLYLDAMEHVA